MKQVLIAKAQINPSALEAALGEALGAVYGGYSTRRGEVVVYLHRAATAQQVAQARAIVREHDPANLTQAQQDEAARQQRLQQARQQNQALLDLSLFEAQPAIIQLLARKIHWLEQEIRELRPDERPNRRL